MINSIPGICSSVQANFTVINPDVSTLKIQIQPSSLSWAMPKPIALLELSPL